MKRLSDLFGNLRVPQIKRPRTSERADLIGYFEEKVNRAREIDSFKRLPLSYFRFILSHIPISDLYFLKSICIDSESRGFRFDAEFWKRIKVETKPGKRKFSAPVDKRVE